MARTRRLAQFWNWLIAFRVVAETEHIGGAADMLSVSPSAVSRTMTLLEQALGLDLFERRGRGIRLSTAGRDLLVYVRDAMRIVDDGVSRIGGAGVTNTVSVIAPEFFATLVVPAICRLQRAQPELAVQLVQRPEEMVPHLLLSGEVDLALHPAPERHPELLIRRFAEIEHGLYCAPDHPLARRKRVTVADLTAHPFVVSDARADGWPSHLARNERLRVSRVEAEIEACRLGLLATLPSRCAAPHLRSRAIVRVPTRLLVPAPYFSVCRRVIAEPGPATAIIDALAAEFRPASPRTTRRA